MVLSILFALVFSVFSAVSLAQEGQTESFTINISGQKTWGISLGIGDPALLSLEGLSPGQPTLSQSLWANIDGKVLDFLTVKASFNDQLGPGFQEFLVIVDRKPWYAEVGRFVVGGEGDKLGLQNKRVLGLRLSLSREDIGLQTLLARLEGLSQTLVFRGTTAQKEMVFSYEDPEEPWLPAPYSQSVEGLFFVNLRVPFVEGFSQPKLAFPAGPEFFQFLEDWDLGYLGEVVEKNRETLLPDGAYLVLRDEGDVLLLRTEPTVLLRNRVLELIDLYNAAQGLTGEAKKTYPFLQGSPLELEFLKNLAEFTDIVVDEESYPLSQAQRRRYLNLGEKNVKSETLSVEIKLPGDIEFRDLLDPALSFYSVRLFSEAGILRLDFPEEFFRPGAAVRVVFEYEREGDTFYLGFSVIPGSERVYLNGELLSRDKDYSIDYEVGFLTLFTALGPDDELRVEFEQERGGLGAPTEYERYFLGASLQVGPAQVGVWQATDVGSPTPSSRTMPNTHSLAALSWHGSLGEWSYSLRLGFSQNVFPFDDNARIPAQNRINAIVSVRSADGELLVFAHGNGITVYQDGVFSSYDQTKGLSGRAALSLLALPNRLLVGTEAGLTVVDLSETGALGRVRSWTRLYAEDWNENRTEKFTGKKVLAMARDATTVYMATETELILAPLVSLIDPSKWERRALPEGTPTVLRKKDVLYLGTDAGLFRLVDGNWEKVSDVFGPVYDLLFRGDEVLVALEEGIRSLGRGWLVWGVPVRSMALWHDSLWYVTESGVFREGQADPVIPGDFTALGVGPDALWAGTSANAAYEIYIWRVDPNPRRFSQGETKIDGRDMGQFRNPSPAEHTRLGPTASLSLGRKFEDWQVGISLYSRFPGYEELESSSRMDAHGIGFSAQYAGEGPLSLDIQGRLDLADLTTNPAPRLAGKFEGLWKGPVVVNLSASPVWRGGSSRTSFSSDLKLSIQGGENPKWNLGFSGKLATPDLQLAGNLSGGAQFQVWPGFNLTISWVRPYRSRGAAGTETIALRGELTGGTGYVWSLGWEENFSHAVGEKEWRSSRTISGGLRLPSFSLAVGKVAPRVEVRFSQDPAEERLDGNLQLNWEGAGAKVALNLGAGQGFRPATERRDQRLSLGLSWSTSSWPNVTPSLNYSRNIRVLLHPRFSPQISDEQSVGAQLRWDPEPGLSHELSLSWRASSLELSHLFRAKTSFGPLEVRNTLTLKDGKVTGKSLVQTGLSLGGQWGVSLEGGLLFGAQPVRVAAFFQATLAVNF